MKAVSLFAGVGGFDLALERNGAEVVATVENDKHAQKVLSNRFPNTKVLGDVKDVRGKQLFELGFNSDGVIVGGFPCQDLSVAGKRRGLAGERSGLFFEVARLLDETKAKWFILENVPGLLSSNGGRDMGIILGALAELGYGIGYRILDAQFFGVPQRRRRVFIVGCLGDDGRTPAKILAIAESRSRYLAESKQQRKNSSRKTSERFNKVSALMARDSKGVGNQYVEDNKLIVFDPHRSDGARIQGDTVNTLTSMMGTGGNNTPMVAYPMHGAMIGRKDTAGPGGSGFQDENKPSYTLTASAQAIHGVVTVEESNSLVRRLTPIECERLQGFPDNWTEGQADGHRYKQMGNAVAVPVVNWIIEKLMEVQQ